VGRDVKRSSAVIVPRTFRVPGGGVPVVPRIYAPVNEDVEYERRVEFDMTRNTGREMGKEHRNTVPASWGRKDQDKKERKEMKEREKEERMGKEKEGRRGTTIMGREVGKGQAPPMGVLHGYKYPAGQPKSILKRTETASPPPVQASGTDTISDETNCSSNRNIFRETTPSTNGSQKRSPLPHSLYRKR